MSTLREKYFEQLKANFDKGLALMSKKNDDYARETDPFNNFRESAAFAEITLEQGILVRTFDKLTRYKNLLRAHSRAGSVGESIEDNLGDSINYLNILKTWHDLGEPEADGSVQESFDFFDSTASVVDAAEDKEADVTDYEEPRPEPSWIRKMIDEYRAKG